MRSHAKASTAGSTQRQAKGLGHSFRGAFATRGVSSDSKGSGAPSARRLAIPLSAFAAILGALVFVVALAAAAAPQATTGAASNIEETAARLNGEVNPEGVELEECKFEYGTTASYGQSKACNLTPAEIGTGTSNVAVSADLTGLTQATTYHFRVVAKSSEGTANGADETFKTLSPPVIAAEWAEGVVQTEATIKGEINPEGFATTYKFEWGPTAAYGNSTAESSVGSDKANHKVSKALSGLEPDATYHYRIVATNSIGTAEGPDHTFTTYAPVSLDTDCSNQVFRTGAAAQLADCRAYEMVSPVDKNNGDIAWFDESANTVSAALNQSSVDGGKIAYSSYKAFGDAVNAAPYTSQYIATRHEGSGWTSHGISPPTRGGMVLTPTHIDLEYKAFSADLSTGWVIPESGLSLAPGAATGYVNIYKRDNATDSYETLTIGERTTPPEYGEYMEFQGSSMDGSHAVFTMNDALTPNASYLGTNGTNVYEWSNGSLRLVSILPNGEPSSGSSSAGSVGSLGASIRGRKSRVNHAISDDGSRIFWTALGASQWGPGKIYVRIDGETTVPVSESVTTEPTQFWAASADGSKAIFSVGGLDSGEADLYEFDVDTETPTLIAHKAFGVFGASDDASYIYFFSKENLDAGATAGEKNLYLHHEGEVSFIETSSPSESLSPTPLEFPVFRNTKVTPDGRHIAFMSYRSLTGYDNTDAGSGKAASEIYRYDADSEELSCVSCNPSGARPSGSHPMPQGPFGYFGGSYVAAWIPTWQNELYSSRSLPDDGNRLFFNSFDALVPQDGNGVQDVYEWEAPGTGSCNEGDPGFSAQNDGCVTLLSSGESPEISEFIDASATGEDAFIRTQSSLRPEDPGLIDLYDARVGGGFPTAPSEPTPCIGDACQGAPEPPNDPTPASAGFRGAGDPTPRKARRGCRARNRHAGKGKSKHTKRCRRNNRRAGR